MDQVSLCSKVHSFPTVIYTSISSGDSVILSERALQSYDAAPVRNGVRGGGKDNDSLGAKVELKWQRTGKRKKNTVLKYFCLKTFSFDRLELYINIFILTENKR